MTTETAPAPVNYHRNVQPANRWLTGLFVTALVFFGLALIGFLMPPESSYSLGAGDVVNFPAMFRQYGLALTSSVIGTGFLIAWGTAGAVAGALWEQRPLSLGNRP